MVNPSSVQGPGRTTGHGRGVHRLPQRPAAVRPPGPVRALLHPGLRQRPPAGRGQGPARPALRAQHRHPDQLGGDRPDRRHRRADRAAAHPAAAGGHGGGRRGRGGRPGPWPPAQAVPRVGPHARPSPPVRRLAGDPRARPALHPAAPGHGGHRPLVRGARGWWCARCPGSPPRPRSPPRPPKTPRRRPGSLFEPPSGREREPSP